MSWMSDEALEREMNRRSFLKTAGALAALSLTFGPAWPSRAGEPIKIGFVPGSISYVDVLVAQQQGFFSDEGLDVTLVASLNGSLAHNALVSGQTDAAPLAGGYVPFVRPTGIQTRQIASRTARNGFSLLVRSGLQADVKTVADLKGRRIMVEALGSSITWAMAINYLRKAGLDPEKEVSLIAAGSRASEVAALTKGDADAVVLDGPADVQLVSSGAAYRLIDPLDPTDHLLWIGNASEDALAWITREATIQASPDRLSALVRAAGKTIAYLRDQHEKGTVAQAAAALAVQFPGLSADDLAESLARFVATLVSDPSLSRIEYYADLVKWVSLGLVQPLPFGEAIAADFAGTRS